MTRVLAVEIDDFNPCELRNLTSRINQLPNDLSKSTVQNLILIPSLDEIHIEKFYSLSTLLFNINTRIKLKRIMAMLGVAANSH